MLKYLNGWTPETVRAHLAKEFKGKGMKEREDDHRPPICAYRGENGTKCVAGCFLPDECYSPALEGLGIGALMRGSDDAAQWPQGTSKAMPFDIGDMQRWQAVHDNELVPKNQTVPEQLAILISWLDAEEAKPEENNTVFNNRL